MKTIIVYILFITASIIHGCIWNQPGLGIRMAIYKTKADYFDNIAVIYDTKKKELIGINLSFEIKDGDTIPMRRQRLTEGYVSDREATFGSTFFLETTYKDALIENPRGSVQMSFEEAEKRIIDFDPFIEFYEAIDYDVLLDSTFLNDIIKNGELEKYFIKLKVTNQYQRYILFWRNLPVINN